MGQRVDLGRVRGSDGKDGRTGPQGPPGPAMITEGIAHIFEEFDDFGDYGARQIEWKTLPANPAAHRAVIAATTNRVMTHPLGIYMRLGQHIIRYDEDLGETARYTHLEAFAWVEIIGDNIFFLSAPQTGTGMQICRLDLETLALQSRSNTLHSVAQNNTGYQISKHGVYFRAANEVRRWDLFTGALAQNANLALTNYTVIDNCVVTAAGVIVFYRLTSPVINAQPPATSGIEFRRFNLITLAEIGSRTIFVANGGTNANRLTHEANPVLDPRQATEFGFTIRFPSTRRNASGVVTSTTHELRWVGVNAALDGLVNIATLNTNTIQTVALTQFFKSPDEQFVVLTWVAPNTQSAPASNQQRVSAIWRWTGTAWQTQLRQNLVHAPIGFSPPAEIIPYDGHDGIFGDCYYLDGITTHTSTMPILTRDLQDVAEIRIPWGVNYPHADKRFPAPNGRVIHRHAGAPNIALAFYYKKRWYTGMTNQWGILPKNTRPVGYREIVKELPKIGGE